MSQRVNHKRWGEGVVEAERYSGLELCVRFTNGLRLWIKRSELSFQNGSSSIVTPVSAVKKSTTQPAPPNYKEREIIECLRLGIVPLQHVQEFTFGMEQEIEIIKKWMNSDRGVLNIIGEYGSGKSHIIGYMIDLALSSEFAVCSTELDWSESPLHNPKKVYNHLLRSFRLKLGDDIFDFRQLLKKIATEKPQFFHDNPYLYKVVSYFQFPNVLEWIMGEAPSGLYRPPLYDHATAANIYCYILSSLAYTLKNFFQKRGLLIVLDEAETMNLLRLNTYQRRRGENFLKGLKMIAKNERALLEEEVILGDGIYRGRETQLIYHAYANQIRYAYKLPSYLKLAVANTMLPPDVDPEKEDYLYLEPLSNKAKRDIINEICRLYQSAYKWKAPIGIEQQIYTMINKNGQLRRFIKSVVEILDYARFYPHSLVKQLESSR